MTMCGILGVTINKFSLDVIRNLYDIFIHQLNRGQRGAGISINNGGSLFRFRSTSPFRLFNVYNYPLWSRLGDGCRVLVHHRYPTSTINQPRFNHPISNEDGTIHLIHNGVMYNEKELYKRLKINHVFETIDNFNGRITDSEVLVHLFEEAYKGKAENIKDALEHTFNKASGSFAVALQITGDKNIYLIRHSYPIVISKDKDDNYYFSSELDKDNKNLEQLYEMADGEIGMLTSGGYVKISQMEAVKNQQVMDYKDYSRYTYGYSGQSKLDDSFDDFDYDNDWNKGREKKKQKKYRRR